MSHSRVEELPDDYEEPSAPAPDPDMMSDEQDIAAAERLKAKGNTLFTQGEHAEALKIYEHAARRLPHKPRADPSKPPKPPVTTSASDEDGVATSASSDQPASPSAEASTDAANAAMDPNVATLVSQVHGNAGFALMKLGQWQDAVPHFDEAVRHNERYEKAYQRRGMCHWELAQWGSCAADLTKAEELGAVLDATWRQRRDEAKKKADEEMAKMWGQLKDLGNMFLGKFGLSTDNFKMVQDPKSGGYSISFQQGGGAGTTAAPTSGQ